MVSSFAHSIKIIPAVIQVFLSPEYMQKLSSLPCRRQDLGSPVYFGGWWGFKPPYDSTGENAFAE